MLIVSQDRKKIVNIDNVFAIEAYEEEIVARATDGRCVDIGSFFNDKKLENVFNDIIGNYRTGSKVFEIPKE